MKRRGKFDMTAAIALAVTCWLLLLSNVYGANAPTNTPKQFDHYSTGFPLVGAHERLNCDACHAHGVMTGTPKQCAACHNGTTAVGKSADHVPTSAACDACHTATTASFAITGNFDHAGLMATCTQCHGEQKSSDHLPTPSGADCDLCHQPSPYTFTSAPLFAHDKVSELRCDACHSGAYAGAGAIGKSNPHPATQPGQDCNACHSTESFGVSGFNGAAFDHSGLGGGCDNCHAKDKPAKHIPVPTGSECILCHRVAPDVFSNALNFTHRKVATLRCDACHNGAYPETGNFVKPPDHIPTPPGKDCGACHNISADFGSATVDHSTITTGCNTCHARDQKGTHIPTPAGAECVLCHRVAPDVFTNAADFTHSKVSAMRCDACHNGAYLAAGAFGKAPDHVATRPGQDCDECHTGTSVFTAAAFDHASITTGCNSCHSRNKPATHLPVPSGAECVLCHRVPPATFDTADDFQHRNVASLRCDACHNGAFITYGAVGKPASHVPTLAGQDCKACHTDTATFAAVSFNHAGLTTGCNSCHANEKPASHLPVPSGAECVLCHRVKPDVFTNAADFNHNKVTSVRCDACHNGSYDAYGAIGKSTDHVPTLSGQDCKACHATTTTFVGATFDHSGVTTGCNSCHLQDKAANHLPVPTGTQCILCHRVAPDVFTNAANFKHSNVTAMRCDGCHSGAYESTGAIGKPPGHLVTQPGQDCDACHTSTTLFATAAIDHSGIVTGCNGCHSKDKPSNHLPVPGGSECILCHRVPPDLFTLAGNFTHGKVSTMRCVTCHNGSYTAYGAIGKPTGHPTVSANQDCKACHTSTANFATVSFNHTGVTTGCNNCHLKDKPASHLPVPAGSECVLCHRVAPENFGDAALFTHGKVTSLRCDACHNGMYKSYGAQGKPADHRKTPAGADCNATGCHRGTSSWGL